MKFSRKTQVKNQILSIIPNTNSGENIYDKVGKDMWIKAHRIWTQVGNHIWGFVFYKTL